MHGWNGGFGMVAMLFGTLLFVAALVGLILLAVWIARRSSGGTSILPGGPAGQTPGTAKEILQARYARGEITREQYQQMLQDIER